MTFYPDPLPVPPQLRTPLFLLEPLTPAHVTLDFAALMESREQLRLWSGSPWPEDSFTLADNRADLAWHADEHAHRIAFTYTVLAPDRERCLGCVYIKSLASILPDATTAPTDSATRFWITTPLLTHGRDRDLLRALLDWFASDAWQFSRTFFTTRAVHARQVALFEALGLVRHGRVELPDRGGAHLIYLPPAVV